MEEKSWKVNTNTSIFTLMSTRTTIPMNTHTMAKSILMSIRTSTLMSTFTSTVMSTPMALLRTRTNMLIRESMGRMSMTTHCMRLRLMSIHIENSR